MKGEWPQGTGQDHGAGQQGSEQDGYGQLRVRRTFESLPQHGQDERRQGPGEEPAKECAGRRSGDARPAPGW